MVYPDAVFFQAKEEVFDESLENLRRAIEFDTYDYIKKIFGISIGKFDGKKGLNLAKLEEVKEDD